MFWWTTLLYTIPVSEKELMVQCDVVLVYIRDGVFGELEPIRGPAPTPKMGKESPPKLPTPPKASTNQTLDTHGEQKQTELDLSDWFQPTGITQSTLVTDAQHDDTDVTPESANALTLRTMRKHDNKPQIPFGRQQHLVLYLRVWMNHYKLKLLLVMMKQIHPHYPASGCFYPKLVQSH